MTPSFAFDPHACQGLQGFAEWQQAHIYHHSLNHEDGSRHVEARLNHRRQFEAAWNALRLSWLRSKAVAA